MDLIFVDLLKSSILDSKKYFNAYNNVKFSKKIQKKIFNFYNLIKLNDDNLIKKFC